MGSVDNDYKIGTDVWVRGTFRDKDGNLADPTLVEAWSIKPDGTQSALSPSQVSTGIYDALIAAVDQSGVWEYKFKGSGSFNVANEATFSVQVTRFS